ncbi:MAG: amidohydrolase family protein [Planctomycetota bacterium]
MLVGVLCAVALLAPQDLVLEGAGVLTGTDSAWGPRVVVRDGRIAPPDAAAPDSAPVRKVPGVVLPGLHDAHAHLQGLGAALENVDLVGTASFAEVVERVQARAARTPVGEWVLGRGWDQNDWDDKAFPGHAALSAAVPDHPVWLVRVDGHAALANARAMALADLTSATATPAGGEILKDAAGAPTGVLIDTAMGLVGGSLPQPGSAQLERQLLAAHDACLAVGLTCVHDAGMSSEQIDIVRRLWLQRRWKLRVYAMLPAAEVEAIRRGPWQTPDDVLIVRAVKGYADGALGSRGAALLAPYSDQPGYRGLMITPRAGLQKLAQLCADTGFQLCVHAIGDAANRAVLDAYAATTFAHGARAARFRIEHAQVVHPDDFVRFASLGVLPSMQPTHLTSDMPWAEARLGQDRIAGAYAWRRFLALGLPLPCGTDFPVEGHDPRLTLFAAVTTRAPGGEVEMRPEQKLSRREALAGMTRDAAYAAFLERELGAIEPGMRADFTVFDRDPLVCAEDEILHMKVLLTVIGGEVVYPR